MKYSCCSSLSLFLLFYILLDVLPSSRGVTHLTTFDPSCKHSVKNIYEIDYNEEEIRKVSLFRKEYRVESYVGYPCKTTLYNKYHQDFQKKGLECPFRTNLESDFQDFIWTDLNYTLQTTKNLTINTENSSLLFQYICFSNQHEKCVFSQDKANLKGTCDGICECMDSVPVEPYNYPGKVNSRDHPPDIIKENEIRCGVKAGGLCIPVWHRTCKEGDPRYNKSLEKNYKKTDFYFKCESNAGCHTAKRICECAQGHECGGGGGDTVFGGGTFNNFLGFMFWTMASIYLSVNL